MFVPAPWRGLVCRREFWQSWRRICWIKPPLASLMLSLVTKSAKRTRLDQSCFSTAVSLGEICPFGPVQLKYHIFKWKICSKKHNNLWHKGALGVTQTDNNPNLSYFWKIFALPGHTFGMAHCCKIWSNYVL